MLEMAGKEISKRGRKSERKNWLQGDLKGAFDVELQHEGQSEDQILTPYCQELETLHRFQKMVA